MARLHFSLLVVLLTALGLSAFLYKWQVLHFPLQPVVEAEVWNIEARITYTPRRQTNKVTLQVPAQTPGFAVLDERFLARNYGMTVESATDSRQVLWAIRRAQGSQALYYRTTVYRDRDAPLDSGRPTLGPKAELAGEPERDAMEVLLERVREQSADISSYAQMLVREVTASPPSAEVELLFAGAAGESARMDLLSRLLAERSIPARVLWGLELGGSVATAELVSYLQVHNGQDWLTINPRNAAEGWPNNFLLWSRGSGPVYEVEATPRSSIQFSVQRNTADAMAIAERRAEVLDVGLVRWSLLSLPVRSQAVWGVLLMVPVGAFIMLVLRNFVGITTFGTFMPVLIALAFRETQLLGGIALFVIVVSFGLLVRFYMEKLRLLLVPRLTAVLVVVVILMAGVSVLSHRLGLEIGLSVALFPMVILAMTIERMSISWEERGAATALKEGIGSLIVAAIAYLVMTWPLLQHLVFVFPELLLVLLAATLLAGRYSGYRLSELFRFRHLARATAAAR